MKWTSLTVLLGLALMFSAFQLYSTSDEDFHQWKTKFRKNYSDKATEFYRHQVFIKNSH